MEAVDGMSVHRDDETMCPLTPLDPHRIRDMVVDQHSMAAGGHLQRMQSMQCFQWSPSAIPALLQAANQSPLRGHSTGSSNNSGSSPAPQRRRLSSGSDSHSMQQQSQATPQNSFNDHVPGNIGVSNNELNSPTRPQNGPSTVPMQQMLPQTPNSIGMVPGQSPLGSPHAPHQPHVQSPFNRNTPGPSMTPQSPFGATSLQQQQMQQQNQFSCQSPAQAGVHMGPMGGPQPQTPGGQNQLTGNQVNMSPSTNQSMFPNPQTPRGAVPFPNHVQQGQTAYPFPPSAGQMVPGQPWISQQQQMQQHYVGQPRMMGNPAGQRLMVQRVPYPTGYYPAMTQAQPGYARPANRPQYPSGNPAAPAQHPQQPGGGGGQPLPLQQTPPSAVTSPPVAYPPQIQVKEQQQAQVQQQVQQQQQNAFAQSVPQTPQTPSGFPNPLLNFPPQAQVPQAAMTPRTPQTPQVRAPLMNAVPPQPPPPPTQHITSPHSIFRVSLTSLSLQCENDYSVSGQRILFGAALHVIRDSHSFAMSEERSTLDGDAVVLANVPLQPVLTTRISNFSVVHQLLNQKRKQEFCSVKAEEAEMRPILFENNNTLKASFQPPPTPEDLSPESELSVDEEEEFEAALGDVEDDMYYEEISQAMELYEAQQELLAQQREATVPQIESPSLHDGNVEPVVKEREAHPFDIGVLLGLRPKDRTNGPQADRNQSGQAGKEQTVPEMAQNSSKLCSTSQSPTEPLDLRVKKPLADVDDSHSDSESAPKDDDNDSSDDIVYPSGSATPSQAPPFTPRFGPPGQGVSPQYPNAANDLRSPGLMSPTQAIRPQCLNDSLVPNMMRVATQPGHFFGHDLHFTVPLEGMCLMGCRFYLVENERNLNDKHDLANLSAVIKYHGGDLKWGAQGISERTTHILCESYVNQVVGRMLKECRKRCVTLQWLNEVIMRKRLEAPWKFCHLPSFWNEQKRPAPGTGKSICVSGYQDIELINVKWMVSAIGYRYSQHLSCENDYLIAKCESEKVEKARDWGVKVLNYRWLLDAYTGLYNGLPDPDNAIYGLGTGEPAPEITTTPFVMERHSEIYNKLLAPWKIPINVSQELYAIGMELRKSMENDENVFPFKKVKNLSPAPSPGQIAQATKIRRDSGETHPKVIIFFSGILSDDVENLTKKAEFLGAEITTDIELCTHFVCVSLLRTIELMKAIALGKNVVSHFFIVYAYMILQFPDTYDFYLRDEENEKNYGYNLKNSVFRARMQPIFEEATFHVMPSVHPSHKIICELIRIAGGIIDEERPSPQFLADCIEYERPYFIIGSEADLHLYYYLLDCKFPIYNEEFVMMAILRQEFDTPAYYLLNPSNSTPASAVSTPSTPNQPRLPPAVNGTANLQNAPPTTPTQLRVKAQ